MEYQKANPRAMERFRTIHTLILGAMLPLSVLMGFYLIASFFLPTSEGEWRMQLSLALFQLIVLLGAFIGFRGMRGRPVHEAWYGLTAVLVAAGGFLQLWIALQ